jgi:hypothetical protein
MTSEILTMFFSETMLTRALNCTGITLQNSGGTASHRLTGCGTVPQGAVAGVSSITSHYVIGDQTLADNANSYLVSVGLNWFDMNELKRKGIADAPGTTYLILDNSTLPDMFEHSVQKRTLVDQLNVQTWYRDTIQPEFTNFTLNMATGILIMSFTESVDHSSLVIGQLMLESNHTGFYNGQSFSLTSASSTLVPQTGGNYYYVEVQIGLADMNEIKRLYPLATDPENTFLSLFHEAIFDTAVIPNEVVSNCQAVPVP